VYGRHLAGPIGPVRYELYEPAPIFFRALFPGMRRKPSTLTQWCVPSWCRSDYRCRS